MIQYKIEFKTIFILILFCFINIILANSNTNADSTAQEFLIIDSHIHNGFENIDNKFKLSNFEYFTRRHISTFLLPLPINNSKTKNLYSRITDEIEQLRLLSKETGMFNVIDTAKLITSNSFTEKPNIIFCLEYFHGVFNGNFEDIINYHNLGVRYITIIDNEFDRLFEKDSLTLSGKKLIQKMNEINILIDIAHLSDDRKLTVINYSNSPVIISHTNARAIADISYNLSDKVLKRLSQKKGYAFVSFNKNGLYNGNAKDTNAIDQFVNHIEYLVDFLGYDHVGIGTDYQANGKYVPQKLNEITAYNEIKEKLLKRRFSIEGIKKIMGNNILKALNYSN